MDATAVQQPQQHRPLFDVTTATNLKPRISSSSNGTVFDANKVQQLPVAVRLHTHNSYNITFKLSSNHVIDVTVFRGTRKEKTSEFPLPTQQRSALVSNIA
jgi:hypothetical protein